MEKGGWKGKREKKQREEEGRGGRRGRRKKRGWVKRSGEDKTVLPLMSSLSSRADRLLAPKI